MNNSIHGLCTCANCLGNACPCGCRPATAAPMTDARASCACTAGCGCDAAEQGCDCKH